MVYMKKTFLLTLFVTILMVTSLVSAEENDPLSVVIIGAGPAGLATAIEAHQNGAEVTLIEKRSSYSRNQVLFLIESSIRLLDKWGVAIPSMSVVQIGENQRIGFVRINVLENSLDKRVSELGIKKLLGEFKELNDGNILLNIENKDVHLNYDILVAADGVHSVVRDRLNISCNCLGAAQAAVGVIMLQVPSSVGITPTIKKNDLLVRKLSTPQASIVFIQTCASTPKDLKISSLEIFTKCCADCGWQMEAEIIGEGKVMIFDNIEVLLQQAQSFSNVNKAAILVGDAAATGSFFQGMGANHAFKTAEIAGAFIKNMKEDAQNAYDSFNQMMKITTDELIQDSAYLFSEINELVEKQ
jgi:2-polyprenyl-6-methoxyphenol hydroxylase-like FAD-dependent oxidoreductase